MLDAGSRTRSHSGASFRLIGLLAGLAVLLGLGVGLGLHALLSTSTPRPVVVTSRHGLDGQATWAAGARPAPPITTLRDQNGHLFSLSSLHGRTVAIVFFDSHCHQECPLEGHALAAAERTLPAGQRPVLVAVSVNPLDTPASARAAVRSWGLSSVAPWYWLMGGRGRLAPVWRSYRIYVAPHPVNGDISHTEAVYLVDRRGFERSAYLYPFATRFVAHDLRVLAGRKGD
jgi:cytochrome oxidase Cu insertion factor (SCO1/SenC/PrrC family)